MIKSVYAYRNGVLCAEAVPLAEIAMDIETPFFCTSAKQVQRNYRVLSAKLGAEFSRICYDISANSNLAVLQLLSVCGADVKVFSSGDIERALAAGCKPSKMMLSGWSKSRDDIAAALLSEVEAITIYSLQDLAFVASVAAALGKTARVSLCVNMQESSAQTPSPMAMTKGLDIECLGEAFRTLFDHGHLSFAGLYVCIDCKKDVLPVLKSVASLTQALRQQALPVPRVWISMDPDLVGIKEHRDQFNDLVKTIACDLVFEAGAWLVKDASVLVATVSQVCREQGQNTVMLNARPTDAFGARPSPAPCEALLLREAVDAVKNKATLVGIGQTSGTVDCTTSFLPEMKIGDLLAIFGAGAYGANMQGLSGREPLPPDVLVSGAQYALMRRRVAAVEQMQWEAIPDWMVNYHAA